MVDSVKIGIVASEFNKVITERLYQGALSVWNEQSDGQSPPSTVWVPGAIEIPLICKKMIRNFDAIVCLGCVIRGETDHFDYVCQMVSQGCHNLALEYSKPVIFGVLTTQTRDLALARSGGEKGNRGTDAMVSAFKMIEIINTLT